MTNTTPQDRFAERWGWSRLVTLPPSPTAAEEQAPPALPASTVEFLTDVGLPEKTHVFLSFDPLRGGLQPLPGLLHEGERLFVLARPYPDYDTGFCIQEHTGRVWAYSRYDLAVHFFVNSDVERLAASLLIYSEQFMGLPLESVPEGFEEKRRVAGRVLAALAAVDPEATGSDDRFWHHEVYENSLDFGDSGEQFDRLFEGT